VSTRFCTPADASDSLRSVKSYSGTAARSEVYGTVRRQARTFGRAVDVRGGGKCEVRGGKRRRPEQRARVRGERVCAQDARLHERERGEERGARDERGAAREPGRQEA
jgi:hypothetical protein